MKFTRPYDNGFPLRVTFPVTSPVVTAVSRPSAHPAHQLTTNNVIQQNMERARLTVEQAPLQKLLPDVEYSSEDIPVEQRFPDSM